MQLGSSTDFSRLIAASLAGALLFGWPAGPAGARAAKRQPRARLITPSMIYISPYGTAYAYTGGRRVPRAAGAGRSGGGRNSSAAYGGNRKYGSGAARTAKGGAG